MDSPTHPTPLILTSYTITVHLSELRMYIGTDLIPFHCYFSTNVLFLFHDLSWDIMLHLGCICFILPDECFKAAN